MTQEQSLQVIVQVCEKANKNGLFTLSESHLVLQALEQFGVKPQIANEVEQAEEAEEVKSETKEVKD